MDSNHFWSLWSFLEPNSFCLTDDPWNYGPFDGPTLQLPRWGWCLPQAWFLADIGCSFSPCCHVPPLPQPQASVWELKGTQKFACLCHPLYPFLMTSWITLTPLPQLPLGLKTRWQCGRQSRHVLWHCLVSKGAAGHRQSSSKKQPWFNQVLFSRKAVIQQFLP